MIALTGSSIISDARRRSRAAWRDGLRRGSFVPVHDRYVIERAKWSSRGSGITNSRCIAEMEDYIARNRAVVVRVGRPVRMKALDKMERIQPPSDLKKAHSASAPPRIPTWP